MKGRALLSIQADEHTYVAIDRTNTRLTVWLRG